MTRLEALRGRDLAALHAAGTPADPAALRGVLDGIVLTGRLAATPWRQLRVWRGKAFDGDGTGLNRLGSGPVEVRRFRFTVRTAPSAFGEREVLLLDHDHDGNPDWVRRFHDELVQIEDGLILATSHHRTEAGLTYLATFALSPA